MKLQLNTYFQQSLKRNRDIDQKLRSFLSIVKQNKINSIHQLSTQLHNQRVMRTAVDNQNKRIHFKKYSSQNTRNSTRNGKPNIQSRTITRKYACKSNNNNDRLEQSAVYYNPNSKIKKHLIESMRFQSLQNMDKDKKQNRFQHFIDHLVLKQRTCQSSQRKRFAASFKIQRAKLVDNQQAIQIFNTSPRNNQQSLFKVKIRKRFWKKEKNSYKNIANLNNELCVKGTKQMAMTIE